MGFVNQFGKVVQAGEDVEIGGLGDDGLDAQRASALAVLLDARVLVAELEPDFGAGGEDAGAVRVAGWPGQPAGERRGDVLGAAVPTLSCTSASKNTDAAEIVESTSVRETSAWRIDSSHQ